MAKGRAVAKAKSNAPALPSFMQDMAGMGTEQIGIQDIETPRLSLLQALSPQVQDGDEKPGTFFHTVLEETIDADELEFIPIFVAQRFLLWRPRHEGGGILARADDGVHWSPDRGSFTIKPYKDVNRTVEWHLRPTVEQSGLSEWGTYDPEEPNSPPAATRMYNFVIILTKRQDLGPMVLTMQRSQIKIARKFLGKLKLAEAPSFGLKYELGAVKDQNNDGQEFWNMKVTGAGLVDEEDLFDRTYHLYKRFAEQGLKIKDEEELQQEGADIGEPEAGPTEEEAKKSKF